MSIRISQSEDAATGKTVLQVEGAITTDTAELLDGVCARLLSHPAAGIVINLSGISFINEDGAIILRRLKQQPGITFEGCQLFTKRVIEECV
jgi:anti-anti-sigma regulatory factor